MTSSCRRAAAAKATNESSFGMACCCPGGLPARHAALKAPPGAAGGQWPQGQPAESCGRRQGGCSLLPQARSAVMQPATRCWQSPPLEQPLLWGGSDCREPRSLNHAVAAPADHNEALQWTAMAAFGPVACCVHGGS